MQGPYIASRCNALQLLEPRIVCCQNSELRGSQTILISSKNHAPDCHGKSQICTIDHMPRANTAALAGSAHTDRIHTPAVRVRVTASPSALKRIQSLNKYANVQPVSDDSSLSCTGLQCTHTARKVYPSSSSDDRVP